MNNAEKFKEVFGVEPDTSCCIMMCETMDNPCEYFEELDGGCHCDSWWDEKYKPQDRRKEKVKINLNDYIEVKLTDLGKDIYYHRFDDLIEKYPNVNIKPNMPDVNQEGLSSFQLWDFILLYGRYIGMAKPNVIEPLDVYMKAEVVE